MQRIVWTNFVDHFFSSVARIVNCHSFFSYETKDIRKNCINAFHFRNIPQTSVQNYLNRMCEYDPLFFKNQIHNLKQNQIGVACLNQNIIPSEYQSFLIKNQVADNIELYFEGNNSELIGVSLIRSTDEGIFSLQDRLIIECCYQIAKFNNQYFSDRPENPCTISYLLTNKEKQVLNLILKGKKNQEIANDMFISLATVKTHIQHIFDKTMVSNKQQLILKTLDQ